MNNTGVLYTELIYPGFISLNHKYWFNFLYQNKLVGIAIDRHIEALQAIDFKNDIKTGKPSRPLYEVNGDGLKINYNVGPLNTPRSVLVDHLEGRILSTKYHTVLIVVHESTRHEKSFSDEMLHQEATDYFIRKYRSIANDTTIPLSSEFQSTRYYTRRYFHEFSDAESELSLEEKLFTPRSLKLSLNGFKFHDLTESVPVYTEDEIANISGRLITLLSSKSLCENNITKESIIQIGREIEIYSNYKFGLLDSFIICESLISNFLRDYKVKQGVSKSKLDTYEKEIPISYLINIELPSFLPDLNEREKEIIGKLNRVRKLRNDIVHKNRDIEKTDALFAFETLQGVYFLLQEKRDKFINKSDT